MQILEKNMKEGQNEFKKPKKPKSASQQAPQKPEVAKGKEMKNLFSLLIAIFSLSLIYLCNKLALRKSTNV